MLRRLAVVLTLSLPCVSGCLPPPALAPASAESHATEQAHLLLFPQANAESLLGRAVQKSSDGSWTIADALAPGCEVSVSREAATFHSSRKVQAHSMTSLAGGYAKLVSVEAKFGQENVADIEVDNTQILHGDMRGACGEFVVDTVFVGHGKRRIEASALTTGKAGVNVGLVSAAPDVDTGASQDDALDWSDDQAYGFRTRENGKSEPLELRASIPSVVTEGDDVEVRFESAAPAWLVVYYIDASGHADVLWPSNEEPEPEAAPGQPAVLPSARERAQGFRIKAALLKPRQPSRETLVVYGFGDKRDFDVMKPGAGSESADGPEYAAALTRKLQNVPMSRWSRAVVGYVIQPRAM
jgi:Domain of unknown function (DUF4384)